MSKKKKIPERKLRLSGIFDTHAHYDDPLFDADREEIITCITDEGYTGIVDIGTNLATSLAACKLSEKYEKFYATVGIHPDCIDIYTEGNVPLSEVIKSLRKLAEEYDKVVAIGEIGLDYFHMTKEREVQVEWFEAQLELAGDMKLSYSIHSRDAEFDTERILKKYASKLKPGIMHCYSYSKESAREFLNMGMYLGIGGVVTFKNAVKLVDVIKYAPLDRLVLETDCPYLSPEPFRGGRNSSLYLPYIAAKIAEIKKIDVEELIQITTQNARTVYGIHI